MRRKQKKLIKRILIVLVVVTAIVAVVRTGVADGLLDTLKGVGKSVQEVVSTTLDTGSTEVENLKKIYAEYLESDENAEGVKKTYFYDSQKTTRETTDGVTATHGVIVTSLPDGLEIPQKVANHPIVEKLGYVLSYNLGYKQADWVAYTLDTNELNTTTTSRSDDFHEELDVLPGSAKLSDYRGSGYDRGHLLSSADRTSSEDLNVSTFSLLNMSPQNHRFNAGLFLKAEEAERDAARKYGILYIATGPVFSDDMDTIGDGVAVPEAFYKVFLGQDSDGEWHAIGLILPQEYENGNLKPYFVTVDEVEEATGIDFYPTLDDAIERIVEAEYDLTYWPKSFR